MKVNLRGLFSNIVSDVPSRRRAYHQHCLDEVYGHIQEVIDGKHTLAEFAEHYCMKPPTLPPSVSESGESEE